MQSSLQKDVALIGGNEDSLFKYTISGLES